MSKLKRLLTKGHGIAALLALVAVYHGWGYVFSPGGTGSNVVLGLLLAMAIAYLIMTNVGPYLDDTFFARGGKERASLLRFADSLRDELTQAMRRDAKGKRPRLTGDTRSALEQTLADLAERTEALRRLEPAGKPHDEAMQGLRDALDAAEPRISAAFGAGQTSVFGQLRSLGIAFAVALALRAFVVEPFQIPSSSMVPTLLIGDHLFVARFLYGLQTPFSDTPSYFARWSTPQPGDVVVFVAPPYVGVNAGEDWIKRVIAGPGQRVRISDRVLYVDEKPYAHLSTSELETYLDFQEETGRWLPDYAVRVKEQIGDITHETYLSQPSRSVTREWPVPGMPALAGLRCDGEACVVEPGHIFVMGDNRDRSSDGRFWGAVPVDNVKGKALFVWMSVDGSERAVELGRFTLPRFRWDRLFAAID